MRRLQSALKEVISSDFVHINPLATLREVLAVMVENRVSAMPVVDSHQRCVGVISVTDLMSVTKDLSDELNALTESGGLDHEALVQKLEHADLLTEQVQGWMSPDPIVVGIESTIQHAAQLMLSNQVHRLIVVGEQNRVVGVVSTMDLLAAFLEEDRD